LEKRKWGGVLVDDAVQVQVSEAANDAGTHQTECHTTGTQRSPDVPAPVMAGSGKRPGLSNPRGGGTPQATGDGGARRPDHLARQSQGLFEHQITNIFHLATIANKQTPKAVIDRIRRAQREEIAERLMALMKEKPDNKADHSWNAGIREALRAVYKQNETPIRTHREGDLIMEGGPALSRSSWHRDWAYQERRDRDRVEAEGRQAQATSTRRRKAKGGR
jgi:hypothetical protein